MTQPTSAAELHALLLANPLWAPPFFKTVLTDAAHADWLGKAVTANPQLANLTDTHLFAVFTNQP